MEIAKEGQGQQPGFLACGQAQWISKFLSLSPSFPLSEGIPRYLRSPPRNCFESHGLTGIHLKSQNTATSVCRILMSSCPQRKIIFCRGRADRCAPGCPTSCQCCSCGGIPKLLWETPSCFFFLKEIPLIFKNG